MANRSLRTLAATLAFLASSTSALQAQSRAERLDAYFTALHAERAFNGTVLLTDSDRVVYDRSFGYADVERAIPNSDSTLLNIASISKPFTAIAVLQLRDARRLSLDDPVARHLPEFPEPRVTVRQLLSHTSGLADAEQVLDSATKAKPDKMFTNADALAILNQVGVARAFPIPPGERWSYSNLGYQVLALLVERVSGMPFDVYMRQHIFLPAGMKDTYVRPTVAQARDTLRATGYTWNNHFAMILERLDTIADMKKFTVGLSALVGSSNVISSARDLRAFDHALYSETLLSRASLAEAFTPVRLANGKANVAAAGSYGLGWFIESDAARGTTVSHSGAAPGITTFLIRNLEKKQTLIILQNIQNPGFQTAPVRRLLDGADERYHQSVAFAYARDLFQLGPDYAAAMFNEHRADSAHYALTEAEMDRVGLEFSRTRQYQSYSLEAYRLNTLLFPQSWKTHDNYAVALASNGRTQAAIVALRRAIALNPAYTAGIARLERLSAAVTTAAPPPSTPHERSH